MSWAPAHRATIALNALDWICIFGEKFVAIVNVVAINTNATTTISPDGRNSRYSGKYVRNRRVSAGAIRISIYELVFNCLHYVFAVISIKALSDPVKLDWIPPNTDTALVFIRLLSSARATHGNQICPIRFRRLST